LASRYLEMVPTEPHQIKSVEEMAVDIINKETHIKELATSEIFQELNKRSPVR
jgi:hypothetical protein